jgi:hypothetical protein
MHLYRFTRKGLRVAFFPPKPAGQSNKKVGFTKLEFDSAVEEAAKKAAQETVAELAKQGWRHP